MQNLEDKGVESAELGKAIKPNKPRLPEVGVRMQESRVPNKVSCQLDISAWVPPFYGQVASAVLQAIKFSEPHLASRLRLVFLSTQSNMKMYQELIILTRLIN